MSVWGAAALTTTASEKKDAGRPAVPDSFYPDSSEQKRRKWNPKECLPVTFFNVVRHLHVNVEEEPGKGADTPKQPPKNSVDCAQTQTPVVVAIHKGSLAVGHCSFEIFDAHKNVVTVTFFLKEEFRGQGYAQRGLCIIARKFLELAKQYSHVEIAVRCGARVSDEVSRKWLRRELRGLDTFQKTLDEAGGTQWVLTNAVPLAEKVKDGIVVPPSAVPVRHPQASEPLSVKDVEKCRVEFNKFATAVGVKNPDSLGFRGLLLHQYFATVRQPSVDIGRKVISSKTDEEAFDEVVGGGMQKFPFSVLHDVYSLMAAKSGPRPSPVICSEKKGC